MNKRAGVDVIIPVYNALNDLKLCIESLKRHTDLALDRIILIDDQSPDKCVFPYMQSIECPGIVVLQNEKNRGFSGTINRGLTYSDRDVILLNSDTVVTSRWIDKLVECAYSDPAIGTATPFSNNATLCSIPNFCQENTIPYGLSIDEYAEVIEHCSLKKYPRITVAVGFCMFIKREAIQCTGLFDAETFQRGYGEENDFCWRMEQLGYYHVLCDTTYIYHSGSASFVSEEKMQLMRDHARILLDWYPKQMHSNDVYVRDNPHQYLRTNVEYYAKLKNGKKNILHVLHLDFRTDAANNIGGTQFHVKDLVNTMRKDNNMFVLARAGEHLRLTIYLEDDTFTFRFYVGAQPDYALFNNKEIAKVYRNILQAFTIDTVHIHHIWNLSFDLFPITKEMGIPLVMTMHDLYGICPTVTMLEAGKHYCDGLDKNCAECIHAQTSYTDRINYMPLWRERWLNAMLMCDVLITPSQSAKDAYVKIYPQIEDRIKVVYHGMDPTENLLDGFQFGATTGFKYCVDHAFTSSYSVSGWAVQENVDTRNSEVLIRIEDQEGKSGEYWALPMHRADLASALGDDKYLYGGFSVQIPDVYFADGPLKMQIVIRTEQQLYHSDVFEVASYTAQKKERKRIAFLGGLNEAKGSQVAYQLMDKYGSNYDWYIIGGIGDSKLTALERKNLFKLGWYKRENICSMLRQYQIDAICILSICAETFCYTLSEAQLAGVPAIVTDIGALGERMRQDQTGWIVPVDITAKELRKRIDSILEDESSYTKTVTHVQEFQHKTIKQMCEQYSDVYEGLDRSGIIKTEFDPYSILMAYTQGSAESAGSHGTSGEAAMFQRINELEAQLNAINQSTEYRMLLFLNRENLPCKKQIKWLIGFAYRIYQKYFKK